MRRWGLMAALLMALGPAGAAAQDGRTPDPRAGETVLLCADGGWDVASGTCRGRGGVIGQQAYGSGIDGRASTNGFVVQPNALFPQGAASVAPIRCGWARPCGDDAP